MDDDETMIEQIRSLAVPLDDAGSLDSLVEAAGQADVVLLGEASHGTSEFYTIRAELTKRLIREKGFSFLAVEGDWPSCYTLNRYLKGCPGAAADARDALRDFNRWPTWMWANREVMELAEWLHDYNGTRKTGDKIGFYGLDVCSLWESMEEVIRHLEKTGSPELETAKRAFACFDPYSRDPQTYGVSAAFLSEGCEEEVVRLLTELRARRKSAGSEDEAALSDEINALVAVNAERYYRAMVRSGEDSWNVRDRHMAEALERIRAFHGPGSKAIVWEHNTHVGDARATDMADEGMVNLGQLVRERLGMDKVFAVGFGTRGGTVIAARDWGGTVEKMRVPDAVPGSWEDLLHRAGAFDKVLLFERMPEAFLDFTGHRAIGVVYHPERERGNYVPSQVGLRYDAFIYVERSQALEPLLQPALQL